MHQAAHSSSKYSSTEMGSASSGIALFQMKFLLFFTNIKIANKVWNCIAETCPSDDNYVFLNFLKATSPSTMSLSVKKIVSSFDGLWSKNSTCYRSLLTCSSTSHSKRHWGEFLRSCSAFHHILILKTTSISFPTSRNVVVVRWIWCSRLQ